MTIAEYQELTGITVSTADTPRVTAAIRKAETKLETLLGYSLSKTKKWSELGKVQLNGAIPFPSLPVSDEIVANLQPSDDTYGDIQLFNFDSLNTHFRINPAQEVYRAKIVLPVNRDEFITICDLENVTPYLNHVSLVTALTRNTGWFSWGWWYSLNGLERNNLMLAVEAKYINICNAEKYPDLAYLLADMISYYSDPNYSVMGNIRSESIDSHSYSRASTGTSPDAASPEGQSTAKLTIARYAGPAAFRKRVA